MGSGDRAYRILRGEARAIQEHQLAMLPIVREQTEMQLEMQEKAAETQLEMRAKAFEQEFAQTEKLNLLALQLEPEPILVAADVTETKPAASKYLVYAGLAALVYFFLMR